MPQDATNFTDLQLLCYVGEKRTKLTRKQLARILGTRTPYIQKVRNDVFSGTTRLSAQQESHIKGQLVSRVEEYIEDNDLTEDEIAELQDAIR